MKYYQNTLRKKVKVVGELFPNVLVFFVVVKVVVSVG
jgi:hypothetical protein